MKSFKKRLESGANNLVGQSRKNRALNLLIKFIQKNKKLLSIIFLIVFLFFLLRNIALSWNEIVSFNWKITPTAIITISISALAVYPINIICWHLIVKTLGGKVRFSDNASVWVISNAARFLPGGLWQYPGRVYLQSQKGLTKKNSVKATALELILNLTVGGSISIFFVGLKYLPFFLIALVLFIIAIKKFFRITYKNLILILLAFFLKFVITGLVLVTIASMALPLTINIVIILEAIFALSWLAGYVVVFAPGGLGVTEASLAALISSSLPVSLGVASALALTYRFVLIISELIVFGIVAINFRKK